MGRVGNILYKPIAKHCIYVEKLRCGMPRNLCTNCLKNLLKEKEFYEWKTDPESLR